MLIREVEDAIAVETAAQNDHTEMSCQYISQIQVLVITKFTTRTHLLPYQDLEWYELVNG